MQREPHIQTISQIFHRTSPKEGVLFLLAGVGIFFLTSLLGNIFLIYEFLQNARTFPLLFSIKLFFALLWNTFPNDLSRVLTILISLLFSINTLLLWKSARWQNLLRQKIGFAGILSAILGIGCLACSGFLPVTAVALFGSGAVSGLLQYQSLFFQSLALFLLLLSTLFISKIIILPSLLGTHLKKNIFVGRKWVFLSVSVIFLVTILFVFRLETAHYLWGLHKSPRLTLLLAPSTIQLFSLM